MEFPFLFYACSAYFPIAHQLCICLTQFSSGASFVSTQGHTIYCFLYSEKIQTLKRTIGAAHMAQTRKHAHSLENYRMTEWRISFFISFHMWQCDFFCLHFLVSMSITMKLRHCCISSTLLTKVIVRVVNIRTRKCQRRSRHTNTQIRLRERERWRKRGSEMLIKALRHTKTKQN